MIPDENIQGKGKGLDSSGSSMIGACRLLEGRSTVEKGTREVVVVTRCRVPKRRRPAFGKDKDRESQLQREMLEAVQTNEKGRYSDSVFES